MQESIPQLEEELEELVGKFVENAVKVRAPLTGEADRHRAFEGHRSAIVRTDGEIDQTEFREFRAESEIPKKTLLYSTLNEILECFLPMVESMANDHEKMFLEVMQQATEKTGNVVDGRGKPFSLEMFLEVLEKIQIDFDADGNPRMPTLTISPPMEAKIKKLINDQGNSGFENKQKEIIDRKRIEWRDREANRTLVG